MKRFGVLLALLVLVSALSVGTGTVRAYTPEQKATVGLITDNTGDTYYTKWKSMLENNGYTTITLSSQDVINGNFGNADVFVVFDTNTSSATTVGAFVDALRGRAVILHDGSKGGVNDNLADLVSAFGLASGVSSSTGNEALKPTQSHDVFTALGWSIGSTYDLSTSSGKAWLTGLTSNAVSYAGTAYSSSENVYVWHKTEYWGYIGALRLSDGDFTTNGQLLVLATIDWLYNQVVANVQFSLKDAFTGQALTGVTAKEGNSTLGTIDDGATLTLTKGTHTLTFEKSGYWSVTKTIDVQGDMNVSIEMYPSSAAFKLENLPTSISIPENTIYELTFTLSPIDTSATYNTYLSISGLSDIIEVRKDGSAISPEGGKYYLGDISSPVQVSIKFKAGAVGQHGFTLSIESHDAIMSQTYTTTKQVVYQVEPLPFSVQMPSEWQVGTNELRISESSGQSYLITAVLKDSSGNEVWSDSHAFSPYEAHSFSINIPSEGSYTLELQWNGQTAVYDITVNPAITLVTKTLTVQKGGEGTIVLHFKNPSSDVQYYTIKVSGGFLPSEINQSISVGPLTEKDVSIAFAVPEELTYDAYELNVTVMQGNASVFSDKVAVSISDSGGFSLFGGSGGTSTWVYVLLGLVVLGGAIWALGRR